MERIILDCQVCRIPFQRVGVLKKHMYSSAHQKRMVNIFQQDTCNGHGVFPSIELIRLKNQIKQPIIGLSLCFSRETVGGFYLCHVCEENICFYQIMQHLCSVDHCSNCFNYTNPNALSFSWIPSGKMSQILRWNVIRKVNEKGCGRLQILDLPGNLFTQVKSCTYSEVMDILSENNKLVKQLEVEPKRMMIQTYQKDSKREHPLLGLQHLVECICVGQTEKRYYLCTLCHLTLPTRAIIKHVLSFDHIFCYFRAWHPSTLLARESYRESSMAFVSKMLDFAKQTEKIHGTANTDMKHVSLEPAKFASVNFTCYAEALEQLESIRKENKESSLITSVTPGNKLEGQCSQQGKMGSYSASSNTASSNPSSSNPASSNLTSSNTASSKAGSNPTSSNLASSNPPSSKAVSSPAVSNPASSNPASSKAVSNPASSKAVSNPASSSPASSNPPSSKASSNPASSKASSNPASSKLASSNLTSSNTASSKAGSNPTSSNLASSNPPSSKAVSSPAVSNPASSNPASSKAVSNPASSKAVSNPASSSPASSNPPSSKASSNPASSKASSNPASSKLASSNLTSSNTASSKAGSNPTSSNLASSSLASSKASSSPAGSNPASSKAVSNPAGSKAVSNTASSKAVSNPASSKVVSNPAVSSPASSKAVSNPASSKAVSNPASSKAVSNPAVSNPASSKAVSNPASSNPPSSKAVSNPASSNPPSSKAVSNPAGSNPASSKAVSNPASSKAVSNPAGSNPANSKAVSNPASSKAASSKAASSKAVSNPASSKAVSNPASSNPASSKAVSNPAVSNPASSKAVSNPAGSNPAGSKAVSNPASSKAVSNPAGSNPANSKAVSNPASSKAASSKAASSKAVSNPASSKAVSNPASSNPASSKAVSNPAVSNPASSKAVSNPAGSNPAGSKAVSNPAVSNPATSKAVSNPASSKAASNPAVSNPASSKAVSNPAVSNPASSKAVSNPASSKAVSNPAGSNPASSKAVSNPAVSNPATSKAVSNPASSKAASNPAVSNPASSKAVSNPAVSNPASSKAVSNPASSKAVSNPASSKAVSSKAVSNPASSKAVSNPAGSNPASSKAVSNPAVSNPASSKAVSNPPSSKAVSNPASSKAVSNPASSNPASSKAVSNPAVSNPASSKAVSNPAGSNPASSKAVSNPAVSNPASSKAVSNPASSKAASNPAVSNPASSKAVSNPASSKAVSNPAVSNPASSKAVSNPASSKAVSNPASSKAVSSKAVSNPASSKAVSNPAGSNPASSKAVSNPASSKAVYNPPSSKAVSNPASSKAVSNPAVSNPASSKAVSNPPSSNPPSSKAVSNPASSKAVSNPASSKASSNPASSKPASSNLTSSNTASSKAGSNPTSSNSASSSLASSNTASSKAGSNPTSSNSASSNPPSSKASSSPASSNPASSSPASSNPASSSPASSSPASSNPVSSNPPSSSPAGSKAGSSPAVTTSLDLHALSYKLHCQNCRESFYIMPRYCRHLSTWEHKQMLKKSHGEEWRPSLGLYKYLLESLRRNQPVVGVPMVVTLISTQVQNEPIYICFACEDCFSESSVKQHFESRKHFVNTVMYQNPWRLPFAWENHLYMKDLRSAAWEEQKERPNQMMLKILDIPNWMLQSLGTLGYQEVMEKLELQHTLLMRDVPKRETYSKLQQNERFPLLGRHFLVMHSVSDSVQQTTGVAFLCLLCARRLLDDEGYTHVFSREHVAAFLDHFHPNSLDPSADAETILDLAKQAAYVHPISHVQMIMLDSPIWEPCSYTTALSILNYAIRREGRERLRPQIIHNKKLRPRGTLKDVDKDHVRDNNQKNSSMMDGCEETSQKSTDNSETILTKTSVEVGAGDTSSRCGESGENAEKGDDKKTPSEKESEKRGGVFSETGSEEIKNAGSETCQEKIEELAVGSGEMPESCQNTDKNDPTERKERSESSKDVLTELPQKRKASPCPVEDVEQEMSHKRQRLTSKEEASCEEPQNLTSSKKAGQMEVNTTDEGESGKPSHETATYKGLSAFECNSEHHPSYPCECCSLRVPEKEFISPVTEVDHQKMQLVGLQKPPPPPEMHQGKTVGDFAALFEQENECGAAQVVDLDDEKQNFKSAIQTVKAPQNQQYSRHELPSTSALSGVQPVDTSVTPHAQHEVCSMTDNHQVVNMEIDVDSEDSVTTAVSAVTETTSSTTRVSPESNEDVKMTHVKASESADNADTSPSEDTATSYKAAASASNTESKVACEAVCRAAPASKVVNAPKNSESASKTVVASRTVVTSVATAKMTAKGENTEASVKTAHVKNSVGSTPDVAPNIHESKAPAGHPHLIRPKNPPTEPTRMKKKSASPHEVGLNQLIIVQCEEKKQVYCRLCSERLPAGRWHVTGVTHQYLYAKKKFPELVSKLTTTELQSELPKLVTLLAKAERDVRSHSIPTVKVNMDEYKELAALSKDKAIERVKAFVRQKDLGFSSPSTADAGVSPCEVSSPHEAVKMVKPQPCAPPLATDAAGSFAQTPGACQEIPEKTHRQERTRPELQDTRKEKKKKASSVKLPKPNPPSSAATVNTEQQNQPGPRRRARHVSKHSQGLPMISVGESMDVRSNLPIYLEGLEPIIGLGLMWECRGISVPTFYLCESCSKTLSSSEIRQHMVSTEHQCSFIRKQHPGFLYFWSDEYLFPWMKQNILKGIAKMLSQRESFHELDAEVILLGPEIFEPVRTAPFSDALKIAQDIKKKKKLNIPYPPSFPPQQKDQQPESRQSPEESLPTEVQPSQALETDQRSDNGARQKAEKHHLEEAVGDVNGVKQRSPLDVTHVSSKADPVVSPSPRADMCLSPQEQPEPTPPVSQHQMPIPGLQVEQAELHSESPSSIIVSPKSSQTLSVSPRDEFFPTRKRAAVESIETLVRSCTNNPQLEDPLPAKCSELQPIGPESASESTSVNPAATSTLLPPTDKDAEPGSDKRVTPIMDMEKFDGLMALLKNLRSERDPSSCTSAPGNGETKTSCASNSSQSGVKGRWDPEPVQATSNMDTEQARCDSEWQMLEDNQLVASNASSAFTASTLTRGDLLVGATEASAADPGAQSTLGSQSNPSPIYDNPGQIPQPRGNTETGSTRVSQLPINAIVTVRSNRPNQRFMGNYKGPNNSEVNWGNQVTHSFSTVATVSPSDASGQHSQMAYGQSGYFSSEAAGSYTAPVNPPVFIERSYQCERYTTGGPYPNQIYPEQKATRFSLQSFEHSLAAPLLPERDQMYQQQLLQQQLLQQQVLQQQCISWRSTSLPAGDATGISGAPYRGSAPVMTPANTSQKMIDLNNYRTDRVALMQNNNVATHNVPQANVNPPVNTEITFQPPANSFFTPGGGFYVIEK